jgi:hypothetical protein
MKNEEGMELRFLMAGDGVEGKEEEGRRNTDRRRRRRRRRRREEYHNGYKEGRSGELLSLKP